MNSCIELCHLNDYFYNILLQSALDIEKVIQNNTVAAQKTDFAPIILKFHELSRNCQELQTALFEIKNSNQKYFNETKLALKNSTDYFLDYIDCYITMYTGMYNASQGKKYGMFAFMEDQRNCKKSKNLLSNSINLLSSLYFELSNICEIN